MTEPNNRTSAKPRAVPKAPKRTVAEKLAVAERLRDLQRALAPVRAANKAKRAAGKVEIRFKTK
jgi:hypothetical protein